MRKQKFMDFLRKIGAYLKKSISHNPAMKAVSIVFAILLYIMVMSISNPPKYKTVRNVPLEITGVSALNGRGLAVVGGKTSIPDTVDVRVYVEVKSLSSVNNSSTGAQLNLGNIVSAGTHDISITGISRFGTVISTNPGTVEVTIERMITSKPLPVKINYEGTLPDGYRLGEAQLNTTTLQLSGAESLVADASYAQITVNLDGLTDKMVAAIPYQVMNGFGQEIPLDDISVAEGDTIQIELPVYEVRELSFNTDGLIVGAVAPGYEITEIQVLPEKTLVAGDPTSLNYISDLSLRGVDVSGAKESIRQEVDVIYPEGINWIEDKKVTVLITIEEIKSVKTFVNVPIEFLNVPAGLEASSETEYAIITITGAKSVVDAMLKEQFIVYVDLSAAKITSNTSYELQVRWVNLVGAGKLQYTIQPKNIFVKITQREES